MTTEELLRAGIAAAKANDTASASKLLIQVVKADPNSELGWLWLGYCRTVPEQREYCFRQVLSINPQNAEARRQIELLRKPVINSQVAKLLTPPSIPSPVSAPPFIEPPKDIPPISQKASPPRQARKPISQKRQKNDSTRFIWVGAGIVVLTCITVAGLVLLGRIINLRDTPANGIQPPTTEPITTATAIVKPTPNYTPSFETTACDFVTPIQVRVTCGFVRVPEDRNGDLTDTIQLAVAIYHSTGDTPKPDPILYLQGGPGAQAIAWSVGAYESVIGPLLEDRDFIVFDQRGVGYSKPVLDCEEIKTTYLRDVQGDLPADQKASYYEGALLTCKNNFDNLGVNPSSYTSVDIAADAKDVILALGYHQANLYGISYGTRIAQFVMRAHPEVVRSAILDSVVPVETQLLKPDTNTQQDRLIRLLFEDCNANPACSSAFPNLESAYNEAINKLDTQPVKVTLTINKEKTLEQTINGSTFRSTIIWGLRNPQTIAAIPHFIYRTRDGDYSQLLYAAALPLITFDSISIGTYVAVNCHDQIFAIPTEGLDETIYDLCRLWGMEPPVPGENDPIHSDIPTLIFAGKYDSVTPTTFASQLASHLAHSYLVEFPNQGHAPSATGISDCPTKIISAFLQDPNTSPDIGCVNETRTINFVIPYNPNTPLVLEPVAIAEYQVSTLIPAGWASGRFGFYNRNGSMTDTTQVGIQRAAVSESEWVAWLFTNFRGNQGFDQPAVKIDERRANSLTWTIYQTSSQGNLVDIAFAKYGKETLMVLLISHKDERDALYNTVFIPIVDSTKSSN